MSITSVRKPVVCAAAALAVVGGVAASGSSAVVFDDGFDYADSAALRAAYTVATGGATSMNQEASFVLRESGSGWIGADNIPDAVPNVTNARFASSNSSYRALGTTISAATHTGFSLTAYIASYRYSATAHVALLNDDGAGYSFTWNTANPNQFNGNGFLNIRSHDTWEGPNTGTALGGTIGGAAPPTGYALPEPYDPANGSPTNPLDYASDAPFLGFVKVTLTWDAATGDLSLYMNDALLATRNDTTHDEFTRVYIGATTAGPSYDRVTVEATPLPEPGSLGLLFGGGLLIAARPRAGDVGD